MNGRSKGFNMSLLTIILPELIKLGLSEIKEGRERRRLKKRVELLKLRKEAEQLNDSTNQ